MAYILPTNLYENCDGVLYCMLDWANTTTDGLFMPAMLLGFVAIMFIATQRFGTPRSFGFSAVFGAFGAMWLATAQLMAWWVSSLFILVGGIGFAVMLLNER